MRYCIELILNINCYVENVSKLTVFVSMRSKYQKEFYILIGYNETVITKLVYKLSKVYKIVIQLTAEHKPDHDPDA